MWIDHPLGYVAAFVLMGPAFARFAILGHEAAHKLLFTNKRWNDAVGRWLVAYPAFVPLDAYRRGHFAHHKDEFGPNEPDLNLYNGYPITDGQLPPQALARRPRHLGLEEPQGPAAVAQEPDGAPARRRASSLAQVPLIVAAILVGRWWLYPLLWLGPWLTSWRVINRLRSIAEHGGMTRSKDRRQTTHHVRQTLARPLPHRAAQHRLAPRPPRRHGRAVAQPARSSTPSWRRPGYVTPELTYPSYRALWRALRSRPEPATDS